MKKIFAIIATLALVVSCSTNEDVNYTTSRVLKGYCSIESRTQFETPTDNQIPFSWSAGDYIWIGTVQSQPIAEACKSANFDFGANTPSVVDNYHVFYNMTGENKTAKVLAEQTADGNLGNDGDFGYALADEFDTFVLEHKVAYLWFDTTSEDVTEKLVSITVTAEEGTALAGERVFDFENDEWEATVADASNEVVLDFGEGVVLSEENEGVFAAMVTLPAEIGGTELTVVYTFADGKTFTEVKTPSKDLTAGAARRIATKIAAKDLVETPNYELRVLTFEDSDARFECYSLDYAGVDITTWSDLIDEPQYGGPLTYGDYMTAMYTWWDEDNTELSHTFPDNYAYCFWGGGHAISNYWGEGYTDEDRDIHIAKYYGEDYVTENAGNDQMLGWFNLQLMIPVEPHSGENFAVHFGYKDAGSMCDNLPELSFADGEARVIDHMYVTNTNYTLNQLYNGVKSEAGNNFGGNWEGLTEDAWLKLVAYGFDDVYADANAEPISEVEFYLVQGMDVVTDWQKWDLSGLGKVAKVRFNFLYSEEMGGSYGFTIPGYFAYDDVAVRFEK